MAQSKREIPHFYVSMDAAVDTALDELRRFNTREEGERVTLTAVLVGAVARALGEHPWLNAHWTEQGLEVMDQINIAVAIALDEGLLAPALLDCRDLDIVTIADRLRSLVERAKSGRLKPREMNEPTFTISNLGMFGVSSFAAILTPPQVAILATGSATPRPVVEEGVVVTRTTMTMTLSADHRALDGAMAAAFLGSVRENLETSLSW